jgi:hypothetical protein
MSVSALRFVPGSLKLTCCGLLGALAAGTSRPTVFSRLLPPGNKVDASSLCTLNGLRSGLFGDLSRGRLLPLITGALLILPTRFEYDSAAGGAGSALAGIAPGLLMGAGTKGPVDELAWPPKMPVDEGASSGAAIMVLLGLLSRGRWPWFSPFMSRVEPT